MRTAFKEWAVIVDLLGNGGQIIILRKGGVREGKGGFQVEHDEFLLFPTHFHQQRESVLPAAQARYDQISSCFPDPDALRIEYWASMKGWIRLDSLAEAQRLRGQHFWRDEVVAERFDWGKEKEIHALAVRVFRLPKPVEIPMLPGYGGCKSWVELALDIDTENSQPVLNDADFARKFMLFKL